MNISQSITRIHREHRVLTHIAFWSVVYLISLSSGNYYNHSDTLPASFGITAVDVALSLLPRIIAAWFLAYFIVPRFIQTRQYGLVIFLFIAGSYGICVLSRITVVKIIEPLYQLAPKSYENYPALFSDLLKLLFVYFFRIFSVAFLFLFLKLLKDQYVMQQKTLTLEKAKAETELKLLKSQLNPHFLFNTLNNIYSLSLLQSPATAASISRLSDILDHILYRSQQLFVPLSAEINLLNNYIGLEKLRYSDRLRIDFITRTEPDSTIAPLLLLSLVENAFKHGAGEDTGDPVIRIELLSGLEFIRFSITNTCAPRQDGSSLHDRDNTTGTGGIGLTNLKKQLELVYPEKHTLEISQSAGLFSVTLTLPSNPDAAAAT